MNGLLLAFQFFTVLPIKKELPLGKKEITMMYCSLPFIGGLIGTVNLLAYFISTNYLEFSPFLTAVVLVSIGFILTGGLHLDGWADTADAFFSYQAPEKRFEVLEDPRLGAFGTMALILLILIKIAFIYEALVQQIEFLYFLIAIPFIARAALNICFATLPSAKKKGLGFFFKERLVTRPVIILSVLYMLVSSLVYSLIWKQFFILFILPIAIGLSIIIFRRWAMRNFNGMTGDLAGAYIEGMEVLLWFVILLLL